MSNKPGESTTITSVDDVVARRAAEIRSSKDFDPRTEEQLDAIYRQYVPPHADEETGHLLDVAERDAYIDVFPPLGSQKMAGVFIKKSVRRAIGWYVQYIAQQISTFGSGISQAMRSVHNDVEDIKKTLGSADVGVLVGSLSLGTLDDEIFQQIVKSVSFSDDLIVVSDVASPPIVKELTTISKRCIVVDSRLSAMDDIDPPTDTRVSDALSFVTSSEDASLGSIILHGSIDVLDSRSRIDLVTQSARARSHAMDR